MKYYNIVYSLSTKAGATVLQKTRVISDSMPGALMTVQHTLIMEGVKINTLEFLKCELASQHNPIV